MDHTSEYRKVAILRHLGHNASFELIMWKAQSTYIASTYQSPDSQVLGDHAVSSRSDNTYPWWVTAVDHVPIIQKRRKSQRLANPTHPALALRNVPIDSGVWWTCGPSNS